jgi:hypothetical protein
MASKPRARRVPASEAAKNCGALADRDDEARSTSDALILAALQTPLPERRRTWSGLVELQACLHRRR